MKILIACEFSGTVRNAFAHRGHSVLSCDLLPSLVAGPHYQGDVFDIINDGWDMMIAFPPCTHLANSGARWFAQKHREQKEALHFVNRLLNAPIPQICLENPLGVISTKIRKPDQIIQPYMFGEERSKRTCLWLKGLPLLKPTRRVGKGEYIRYPCGGSLPKWYSNLGKRRRQTVRSITPECIALAMAEHGVKCVPCSCESQGLALQPCQRRGLSRRLLAPTKR